MTRKIVTVCAPIPFGVDVTVTGAGAVRQIGRPVGGSFVGFRGLSWRHGPAVGLRRGARACRGPHHGPAAATEMGPVATVLGGRTSADFPPDHTLLRPENMAVRTLGRRRFHPVHTQIFAHLFDRVIPWLLPRFVGKTAGAHTFSPLATGVSGGRAVGGLGSYRGSCDAPPGGCLRVQGSVRGGRPRSDRECHRRPRQISVQREGEVPRAGAVLETTCRGDRVRRHRDPRGL